MRSQPTPAIRHNGSRGAGISRIAVIRQAQISTMRPAGVGHKKTPRVAKIDRGCVLTSSRNLWLTRRNADGEFDPKSCETKVVMLRDYFFLEAAEHIFSGK